MGVSSWNGVVILSGTCHKYFRFGGRFLDKKRPPVTSGSNRDSAIEFLNHVNIDLAVDFVALLSCIEAEEGVGLLPF